MKITSLTTFCVDFFPELDQIYVGGNSLNFAIQCIQSGIEDVSVVGAVGKDRLGILIKQYLEKRKIYHSHLYTIDAATASNRIYISEDGDRYFKDDSWNGGAFDVFRLSEKDWNFLELADIIAMPAGDPNFKELLRRRTQRQLVVIDFLDYHTLDSIATSIENIDIVFLSADEKMFNGLNDLARKSGKLFVATLGAKGSAAFFNKSSYFQDAIEVGEIVDTTGCGDAFQAAFTIEWFKSRNINNALYQGSEAASKVLSFVGGVK